MWKDWKVGNLRSHYIESSRSFVGTGDSRMGIGPRNLPKMQFLDLSRSLP